MKLLIGIPTLDFMHTEFVRSLTGLLIRLKDEGVNFELAIESGTLVYLARERIANKAINNGFDWVLWLDSDMVFSPDLLDDLMFSGKEFVSGIYHARRKGYASCIFKQYTPTVERFEQYPADTFRIAGCGFGAVLTKTNVLKDVNLAYRTCFTPLPALGEDLAFCDRARGIGYEIWCEPSAVCGHIGHITIYPEDHEAWKKTISNYAEVAT